MHPRERDEQGNVLPKDPDWSDDSVNHTFRRPSKIVRMLSTEKQVIQGKPSWDERFTTIVDPWDREVLFDIHTFLTALKSEKVTKGHDTKCFVKDTDKSCTEDERCAISAIHVYMYTSKLFKGLFIIGQLFLAGETAILCTSQATVMTGSSRFTLDTNDKNPWSPWTVSITTAGATLGLCFVYLFVGLRFSKLGHSSFAHVEQVILESLRLRKPRYASLHQSKSGQPAGQTKGPDHLRASVDATSQQLAQQLSSLNQSIERFSSETNNAFQEIGLR
jgi:hypothetical protein